MGKAQKKRSMRRHNPMRVPDSHLPKGLASASSSSSKNADILPIIQKMESPDPVERKWSCVAVCNLINNDPSTRRLLQGKNIVGSLISRLSDSEEEVVVEAAGALRNLCIDGGYDICGEMYNKNIVAPLQTFIPKISTALSQYIDNPKAAPESAQKVVYEFADNVITILWCLSETSHKALTAVNQLSLVPFLMSFLASREKLPLSTVTSAAQCLYVLTDDNYPASAEIKSNTTYSSCLLEIAQARGSIPNPKGKSTKAEERATTLCVLACGILRNVAPFPPPSAVAAVDLDKDVLLPVLVPVVSSVSLSDASNAVEVLVQQQASEPQKEKQSVKHAPQSDHKNPTEIELERIETTLRTVHLALEILTGVCATLPEPEVVEGEEEEEEEQEEEADDDAMDTAPADNPPTANGAPSSNASFLPSLLQPLLSLIQPTTLSFPPPSSPSIHPPTTSVLSSIHVSAMECLNNAFLSLAPNVSPTIAADVDSGSRVWEAVWNALSATGTEIKPGQEKKTEIWETAVGVFWGVGIVWTGKMTPQEERIKVLMEVCNSTKNEAVKVKCIGTLESLAQNTESIEANRVISSYLISLLPSATSASSAGTEPMLQAASALIDIYSDETLPYDVNFRQGNYLEALTNAVEGVRKAVKGIDRKKEGGRELKHRGEEVRDNLVAFIKYRRRLGL